MSLNNLGFPYDATSSWNGYNHQGKIALWFTIKQIIDLWDKTKSVADNMDALQEYHLELEYLEDFSIVRINGTEKKYLTIHQVKSREDTSVTAYEEAILNLVVKLINYPTVEHAYLHVTSMMNLENTSFSDSVLKIITETNKLMGYEKKLQSSVVKKTFKNSSIQ